MANLHLLLVLLFRLFVITTSNQLRYFSKLFNLEDITGKNGIQFDGLSGDDYGLGTAVSNAGDINGDGYDDVLIGASATEKAYVLFGSSDVVKSGIFELDSLDGSHGFVINGTVSGDFFGYSVSGAGDINGDGYDDVLIGAPYAGSTSNSNVGETYVVFGASGVGSRGSVDLNGLDGSNGFVITGEATGDYSGYSVSNGGDFNGDGFGDLLIGAYSADRDPFYIRDSGKTYLLYGSTSVGIGGTISLSSLSGTNGFIIYGIDSFDYSGCSVSDAGDFNGDGYDDVVIGAFKADPNSLFSGESYLIFGGPNVSSNGELFLSSLDGSNGIVINGEHPYDKAGFVVSDAGDFNGDGYDDVLIGAPFATETGVDVDVGKTYIVYGGPNNVGINSSIELSSLDGSNGIVLIGMNASDYSGYSLGSAGDVNGDGFGDVIIGAYNAGVNNAGQSYVVFGGSNVAERFQLSALDGSNGFVVAGEYASDFSGVGVCGGGDFNNDTYPDVIIGASGAGWSSPGAVYILFNTEVSFPGTKAHDSITPVVVSAISGLLFFGALFLLYKWFRKPVDGEIIVNEISSPIGIIEMQEARQQTALPLTVSSVSNPISGKADIKTRKLTELYHGKAPTETVIAVPVTENNLNRAGIVLATVLDLDSSD